MLASNRVLQGLSTLTVTREMYFNGMPPMDAARRDVSTAMVEVFAIVSVQNPNECEVVEERVEGGLDVVVGCSNLTSRSY